LTSTVFIKYSQYIKGSGIFGLPQDNATFDFEQETFTLQ